MSVPPRPPAADGPPPRPVGPLVAYLLGRPLAAVLAPAVPRYLHLWVAEAAKRVGR